MSAQTEHELVKLLHEKDRTIDELHEELDAVRKLLCRIATFLSQCDSSSPKVPELIAGIERSLSGKTPGAELAKADALAKEERELVQRLEKVRELLKNFPRATWD